jgi:hypothetical protein
VVKQNRKSHQRSKQKSRPRVNASGCGRGSDYWFGGVGGVCGVVLSGGVVDGDVSGAVAGGVDGAVVAPLLPDGVMFCVGGAASGVLDGAVEDGGDVVGVCTFTDVSDVRGVKAPNAKSAMAIAAMTAMTMASAAMPEPLSVFLSIIVAMNVFLHL